MIGEVIVVSVTVLIVSSLWFADRFFKSALGLEPDKDRNEAFPY
jgi:hypothetical protein